MEWFRWYHGAVTDPKFRVVARKSKASISHVIAVWAFLLESASADGERGSIAGADPEAIDAAFDFDDGVAGAILDAFKARGMVRDDAIAAWEKRQPKRERDDDSAERVRRYREKQRKRDEGNASVTPCNATQRQETPRGEEIRVEERRENPPTPLASERPAGAGGDSLSVASPPEPDHPAWSPPPLVFTRGVERDPSADAAWAERIESLWRERKGGRLRRDQVIGLLAEHVDELGADEVVSRLDRYCEQVSGQYATLRNFAGCIGDWSEQRRKQLDEDEPLSLDEALRRSRESAQARRAARAAEQKASAA